MPLKPEHFILKSFFCLDITWFGFLSWFKLRWQQSPTKRFAHSARQWDGEENWKRVKPTG